MTMRNWKYGAKAPTVGLDRVLGQIRAAHRYRNFLVENELWRRSQTEAALNRLRPELAPLRAAVEEANGKLDAAQKSLGRAKAEARSHAVDPAAKAAVRDLRADLRAARVALRDARRACRADEAVLDESLRIGMEAADRMKAGRKRFVEEEGLYWGTYGIIDQAAASFGTGAPPRFHAFRGDGAVAVQIIGGMSVEELAGPHSQLRVEAAGGKRATCRLRVGSDADRRPVWAEVPFVLHRPIPAGCRVKGCRLLKRRVGTHDKWEIIFSVEGPESAFAKPMAAAGSGSVGVDLGWRVVRDGLRVAYWLGSDGGEGELVIPTADLRRWTIVDELRSVRDPRFNAARDALAGWLDGRSVPQWLTERAKTLWQWRSPARLAALAREWRKNRFDGDAEAFAALDGWADDGRSDRRVSAASAAFDHEAEAWTKKDRHLYDWESFARRRALSWRDDLYRRFVAGLRRRYARVVIEDTDWRRLARSRPTEDAAAADAAAAHWRRVAAVGRLAALLDEGMATVKVPAADTSRRCADCGRVEAFEAAAHLHATCSACGRTEDQDRRAARNLLAAAPAPASAEVAAGAAGDARGEGGDATCEPKGGGRWQRKGREKAARSLAAAQAAEVK